MKWLNNKLPKPLLKAMGADEVDDRKEFELPDPTPMAPPLGYKRSPSLAENMRAMIRGEMSRLAAERGFESFEEADDFQIGDDYEPSSPHELDESVPSVSDLKADVLAAEARLQAAISPTRDNATPAAKPAEAGGPQGNPPAPAPAPAGAEFPVS